MSASLEKQLMMLFERPFEPVFFPKGDNVCIEVPEDLLSKDNSAFVRSKASLSENFPSAQRVPAALPPRPPGAAFTLRSSASDDVAAALAAAAAALPRDEFFSLHVAPHRKAAARLISLMLAEKKLEDVLALAVRSRETLNPQLFQYVLSVTILHRPDLRNLRPPALLRTMPGKFLSSSTLRRCYEQANLFPQKSAHLRKEVEAVEPLQTALDSDPEHKLAYFREDPAVNLHHWHWHLVYPTTSEGKPNMLSIVSKDRRGELFYYMHHQVLARYNAERFSVGLGRLQRFQSFREPIVHGYYPKIGSAMTGKIYVGRPDNCKLSDINRGSRHVEIKELERWEDRIVYAIESNTYFEENKKEPQTFSVDRGIDVLGNMVEASDLSPNKKLYGNLHNLFHIAVCYCHDPDGKHLEDSQVMGGSETAMRDPAFYQLHSHIDHIFRKYKHTLPPYTLQELQFPGVTVTGIEVQSQALPGGSPSPPNHLHTHWQRSAVDISGGLDYAPRGPQRVVFKHLQHVDFKYSITVNNSPKPRKCVVRLFLAPLMDDQGIPLSFIDHKEYFIEMDKFEVELPVGQSVVERPSVASSVTIPWEQTFRRMQEIAPEDGRGQQEAGYCGCGWPHHLLLPRGTHEGLKCVLVAILTDFKTDIVAPLPDTAKCSRPECKAAVSYCGARDSKYPDRRPMGFPFDRVPRYSRDINVHDVTLEDFMRNVPNMSSQEVVIVHSSAVTSKE